MKIRFAHKYTKFPVCCLDNSTNVKDVTLLQVLKVKRSELSKAFVTYDTEYGSKNKGYRLLPDSDLILLLLHNYHGQFTTLRRYSPEKYAEYKKHEGRKVEIVIA